MKEIVLKSSLWQINNGGGPRPAGNNFINSDFTSYDLQSRLKATAIVFEVFENL